MTRIFGWAALALILAAPVHAQDAPKPENDRPAWAKKATPEKAKAQTPVSDIGKIRTIPADENGIAELTMRAGRVTMLVFPATVHVSKVDMGDWKLWKPEQRGDNVIAFSPTVDDISTNLLVTTDTGAIHAYFVRSSAHLEPDVKVTVDDGGVPDQRPKQYYTAADVALLQRNLDAATAKVEAVQAESARTIEELKATAPTSLSYYKVDNRPPFQIHGMVADGVKTYVKLGGGEVPVVYEMVDDKPSIVNTQVQDGDWMVISKVVGSGYFTLGKMRLGFRPLTANGN